MSDDQPKTYSVAMGRFSLYYTADDRELRFDMLDSGGARSARIVVDRFPRWYAAKDCSDLGEVAEEDRPQILEHIRAKLETDRFQFILVDRNNNRIG